MKKIVIVTGICTALLIIACSQFNNNKGGADPRGDAFTGSKACAKCHAAIYNSYLHTAHYISSRPATENTVHGSFAGDSNVFYINKSQKVVMEKRDSGLYQAYYENGKLKERHRFAITFGGIKGETYLYWKGTELYQLPLSYFSAEHKWSTSPGLGLNFIDYPQARSIGMRCLECHASYISYLPEEAQKLNGLEEFDKSSLVYNVDCERCHGPGARHVDFQTNNPGVKTARFITTFSSLSRNQKLDQCGVCHSGNSGFMLKSTFGFMPGDTLAKFKLPDLPRKIDTNSLDVHGNQLQLLKSSKCFIYSKMDCSTCHDTHKNTRGNDALYTQKCLDCHNSPNHSSCKMAGQISATVLKTNCIKCHMPALTTKAISVQVSDKLPPIQFYVHTHRIAIYPQQVKKILAYVN